MEASEQSMSDSGKEAGQRDLKRGNINFDLLEPEQPVGRLHAMHEKALEESPGFESKRGMFEIKGRTKQLGTLQLFSWTAIFFLSAGSLVAILFLAHSILWILALPPLFVGLFWSFMMLVLYKARPR